MDQETTDRRAARRFAMALPLLVKFTCGDGISEKAAETHDISFRGVYFFTDTPPEQGSAVELVLTLPQQITLAGDVRIRCFASVLRVEPRDTTRGVAARIDRYEFLPTPASNSPH